MSGTSAHHVSSPNFPGKDLLASGHRSLEKLSDFLRSPSKFMAPLVFNAGSPDCEGRAFEICCSASTR